MAQRPVPRRLIGRTADLERARRLLGNAEVRVLSLLGPPGVGKTRLAAELLAGRATEPATFVPLADVADASAVGALVAERLGGPDRPGRDAWRTVAETIGSSSHLLVLDNFEHVATAAAAVAALVDSCPELMVLVTSRRPLSIRAEHCLLLEPLAVPDVTPATLREATDVAAVALLGELLTGIGLDLPDTPDTVAALVRICRQLDGLPLALELAAARARVLPLPSLAGALDERLALLTRGAGDLPGRQRTMRAAVEWSYDLLDADAAGAFRRLGVCIGGVPAGLAGELVAAGGGGPGGAELDLLDDLVSGSLLRRVDEPTGSRFVMLEVVRELAADLLARSGEAAAARGRHAAAFLRRVEADSPHGAADQTAWLDRMQRDAGNLTAAIRWAVSADDADTALRLCLSLRFLWYVRGPLAQGRQLFDEALGVAGAPPDVRSRALVEASALARHQGDVAAARRLAGEAVALAGDEPALAAALLQLGFACHLAADYPAARAALERSHALAVAGGDPLAVAKAALHLGFVAYYGEGDAAAAAGYQEAALQGFTTHGSARHEATALIATAELARSRRDLDAADARLGQAVARIGQLHDLPLLVHALHVAASTAADRGRHHRAVRLLGAAEGLERSAGAATWPAVAGAAARWLPAARARLGAPRVAALRAEGSALPAEQVLALALAVADAGRDGLTGREHEVAGLVAGGLTNRAIAQRLVVSTRTVDGHVARILTKLGFTSRAQLAAWFVMRTGTDNG